ncbi:MAG: Asp-tRNA(Asn)/Glu-tRNA(Gln) amidotransferase subunit GatC [Clostridia bacterium]|nr:Asp-tRNA(Asn)/Glu-tRNA(Gln) amidotransferase subunit GatC [Clostridia bacterium]
MKPTVDIHRLAALSRLELSDEEAARLERDMAAMIAFADTLSSVPADAIPADSARSLSPAIREDVPGAVCDRETLLAAAKTTHRGYVTVPRVLED